MKHRAFFAVPIAIVLLSACATPPDLTPLETSLSTREARVSDALAQTPFGQAVENAVTRSPQLTRGFATLREAEAGLIGEGGAYRPEVSVGVRPEDEPGLHSSGFASLSLLLYDGGASASRKTAARARVLGGVAGLYDLGSVAALDAVQTWAEVVTARDLLSVSQTTLASLETTVTRIQDRAAAGAGASGDVLTARSRLANERAAAAAEEAEVARAEAVFVEIFGHAPSDGLRLPSHAPSVPLTDQHDSPILQNAQAAVLAAKADHAAALAGRAPTLSVTVSALMGVQAVAGLASEQRLTPANRRKARVAAAEARIEARHGDLDAAERELKSRLRILATEIAATERRMTAAKDASAANQSNLAVLRDQFETGRQSLIGLLDAEREALTAERQRITTEHDRVVLSYALLAATGDILDLFDITFEHGALPAILQ